MVRRVAETTWLYVSRYTGFKEPSEVRDSMFDIYFCKNILVTTIIYHCRFDEFVNYTSIISSIPRHQGGLRLPPNRPFPGPGMGDLVVQAQDLAGWAATLTLAIPTVLVLLLYRALAVALLFLQ